MYVDRAVRTTLREVRALSAQRIAIGMHSMPADPELIPCTAGHRAVTHSTQTYETAEQMDPT
jgi:hypothetical protein